MTPAGALEDDFLNANPSAVEATWTWPGADEVVLDTRPPAIAQARLRAGRVEIELTEEVVAASAASTVTIDGGLATSSRSTASPGRAIPWVRAGASPSSASRRPTPMWPGSPSRSTSAEYGPRAAPVWTTSS